MMRIAIAPAAALILAAAGPNAAAQSRADLLLVNGRVLTVDAADRVAQAVGIAGNRIVVVGTTAEVERAAAPNARRIDLAGRTVTPGLLDAHAHFSAVAPSACTCSTSATRTSRASRCRRRDSREEPPRQKARGSRAAAGTRASSPNAASSRRRTSTPRRPTTRLLTQTTGHYGVANSAALRLAGITKDTRDPPSGTIDRNPDGTPTGLLREAAAETRLAPRAATVVRPKSKPASATS